MKLSRRGALLGIGSALVVPRLARADTAPCTDEQIEHALADVAKARTGLTSLQGPFTQERKIGLLAAKVRSTGALTVVRPDRLRWELDPPDAVTYWVTPEGLAFKSASSEGRVAGAGGKIAAALSDLRALLGGDLAGLRVRYDLRGTCGGEGGIVFEAVPKAQGNPGGSPLAVQRIVFTLTPDLVSPQKVTLIETERDRTDIVFGAMTKNAPIAPARMRPPS